MYIKSRKVVLFNSITRQGSEKRSFVLNGGPTLWIRLFCRGSFATATGR